MFQLFACQSHARSAGNIGLEAFRNQAGNQVTVGAHSGDIVR